VTSHITPQGVDARAREPEGTSSCLRSNRPPRIRQRRADAGPVSGSVETSKFGESERTWILMRVQKVLKCEFREDLPRSQSAANYVQKESIGAAVDLE
jgi:hypothetical protein